MPRSANQPDTSASAEGTGSIPTVEKLLHPGAPGYRAYRWLGLLALGVVGVFGWLWITVPGRWIPVADGGFSLLVGYAIALWMARWASLRHMARPVPIEAAGELRVGVATSFVPGVEPLPMLEETVRRLVAMDYPHETWVLDEGAASDVRELCGRYGALYFTRLNDPSRRTTAGRFAASTKHGNFNAWLDTVAYRRYDVVALFDPDHVPEADYLVATLGHLRDGKVGFVQPPQVYYNQRASFIAAGAAEETYRYYSSGLLASQGLGHSIIVGSHTVHRAAALEAVGGLPDHDAEDLALGRRYQAAGWRGVFVPRILALGLVPTDWSGYLQQQRRWARAILDLKLRPPPELAANLTPRGRILNLLHGAYYLRPLGLLLLYPILLGVIVTNAVPAFVAPGRIVALAALVLALITIGRFDDRFLLDPAREKGWRWRAGILQVAKAPYLVAALGDVLLGRRPGYVTTPKVGGPGRGAVALPHLGLAVAFALALGIGWLRFGMALAPVLVAVGAAAIAIFVLLAWTDAWTYQAPYELGQYEKRRRVLDDVIGQMAGSQSRWR